MSNKKDRALGALTEAVVKLQQRPTPAASKRVAAAGVRAAKAGATVGDLSGARERGAAIVRAAEFRGGGGKKKRRG